MQEAVRVDIAEPRPHGLIDEEQVRKFIPRSLIILEVGIIL